MNAPDELIGYSCTLAGPGRGDCFHFVGLPGRSIPGQHDGPDDTVDCYGKPNGWCWTCWRSYQIAELRAELHTVKLSRAAALSQEQRTRNECNRLRGQLAALKSLSNWAETLLCNVIPMPHCSQAGWDGLLKKWRDEKHTLLP